MPTNSKPKKNSLSIRLTESAVFLRTDYTPTRQNIPPTSSTRNGLLRGLLVLEIAKPTKISSIEVELTGTTFTAYPEGALSLFPFLYCIQLIYSHRRWFPTGGSKRRTQDFPRFHHILSRMSPSVWAIIEPQKNRVHRSRYILQPRTDCTS